jgi:hypothetical protein
MITPEDIDLDRLAVSIEGGGLRPAEQGTAPSHLVPLAGGSFGLWPWACLRGAGFPAETVLSLVAPETAAAIDQLLDAETADPGGSAGGIAIPDALRRSFEAETARVSEALRTTVQGGRFREAVIWQNRRAVHTGLDHLARTPGGQRDKKTRQREALVASYLQRYCVKNDSIGFFGPVGWCRVGRGPEAIVVRPGPGLLAARQVYFEGWCIDAITALLAHNPALRPWAVPRFAPYLRLEGAVLHVPGLGAIDLHPAQSAVLRSCDGAATARDLAVRLAGDPSSGLASEAEVLDILERARAMKVISWDFEVPLQLHPERALRGLLERIEDAALRAQATAPLEEIEQARDVVAAAAGDPSALDAAMARLEETFQRMTGAATTRAGGQMYAGRTLLYEDCRRDLDMEIGAPLLDKLAQPLSLLFLTSRWATHEVARRYRAQMRRLFDSLTERQGGGPVELTTFHKALVDSEPWMTARRGLPPVVAEVREEIQRRWAEILQLPEGARRVERDPAALRSHVLRLFDAPHAGWALARYVSPDLMIAARDVDAIRRGECTLIMGELHVRNTIATSCFASQHPSLQELCDLWELDNPAPNVMTVMPRTEWLQRVSQLVTASYDLRYSFAPEPSPAPAAQTLRAADLLVVDQGGALEVHARDGRFRDDLIHFIGEILSFMATRVVDILPEADHAPRVKLGELVVARECWRFVASQVAFAEIKDPLARWIEARRWRRRHGMPRFVFFKSPVEEKPCYVDFDSPIYVDALAKMVRRAAESGASARVSLTEMLPGMDDLWLTDAEGERYTCELRLVAFDAAGSGS